MQLFKKKHFYLFYYRSCYFTHKTSALSSGGIPYGFALNKSVYFLVLHVVDKQDVVTVNITLIAPLSKRIFHKNDKMKAFGEM